MKDPIPEPSVDSILIGLMWLTKPRGLEELNQAKSQLYKLLVSKAEQRQIVVAYKKDNCHTPILQDWQAIPISAINDLFGEEEK